MPNQTQVVWVCQWYPHEGEPYTGDFIQRHAKAASLFLPVTTFSCFPHTCNKVESHTAGNLTEHIIYFTTIRTGIPLLDKAVRWRKWFSLLKQHLRHHIRVNGKPDLLHCHITLNTGWLGLWAKKNWNIPYLVTEHWSGFMPGAINGFTAYNRWSKRSFTRIFNQAAVVTGVSKALIQVLQNLHHQASYIHLPNVVDEAVFRFYKQQKADSIFRVLHISTFSAHKNMDDTFTALDAFAAGNEAVEIHLVGPWEKIAEKWPHRKFSPAYRFHAEMPQTELAVLMRSCDVCVLYSHYETFGCVIIEANAVGLPVLVSDIPVLQEIVQSRQNGLLVTPSSPAALHRVLEACINQQHHFNGAEIAGTTVDRFNYKKIGRQIYDLYLAIIGRKN